MEGLGELYAGVEVVPGFVLMWRDWVSSVLGLRLCIDVEGLAELCAGVDDVPGCVLMWRD